MITEENGEKIIFKFSWFERYFDFILWVIVFSLFETFWILARRPLFKSELNLLIFIIIMVSILIIQWFCVLTFKRIIEINFKKNRIIVHKNFKKSIELVLKDIISINTSLGISSGGADFEIYAKSKNVYGRSSLLVLFRSGEKPLEYYKYYIDLLCILIVRQLNERGYNIESKFLTNIQESAVQLSLKPNNLQELAEKYSKCKKFSVNFVICGALFIIGLLIYGNVVSLSELIFKI